MVIVKLVVNLWAVACGILPVHLSISYIPIHPSSAIVPTNQPFSEILTSLVAIQCSLSSVNLKGLTDLFVTVGQCC